MAINVVDINSLVEIDSFSYSQEEPPEKRSIGPSDKTQRQCLFCGRGQSDGARYKSVSHLLPEGLGNRYLFSNRECDDCNHKFGNRVDNDFLSAVTGFRLNLFMSGKNGRIKVRDPKLKSNILAGAPGESIQITQQEKEEAIVKFIDDHQLELQIFVPGHRSSAIPRALARYGLMMCPELLSDRYPHVIPWLREEQEILPITFVRAFIRGPGLSKTALRVVEFKNDGPFQHAVLLGFSNVVLAFHYPPVSGSPDDLEYWFPALPPPVPYSLEIPISQLTMRKEAAIKAGHESRIMHYDRKEDLLSTDGEE
ncbi:HNH endonuclease [Myxococcota bacterium]